MAYVDSHTEGEPTRVVHAGLPALGEGPPRARLARLAHEHPGLRATLVDEPRGHAALVAALLLLASDSDADYQVLFLNNVGALPMCVHASIGIARSLVHLGLRPASPWTKHSRISKARSGTANSTVKGSHSGPAATGKVTGSSNGPVAPV